MSRPADTYRAARRNSTRWFPALFRRLEGSNWRQDFNAARHVKIRPHKCQSIDYSKCDRAMWNKVKEAFRNGKVLPDLRR